MMERLNNLRLLLADAVKDEINNRAFIEDLLISIEYQQAIIDKMILYKVITNDLG